MQSRILLVVFCTLGSAVAFAAAACSSDSPEATFGDGGSSGGDGATTGDGGGSGNDGGTDNDSGFAGDSGTVDAGQCANEPLLAADGGYRASCATCLNDNCCAQVKACEGNADCKEFASCYAVCELSKPADAGTQYCVAHCAQGKDASALGAMQPIYNALVLCGGNSCHNDGGASVPQCPF